MDDFEELALLAHRAWSEDSERQIQALIRCVLELRDRVKELECVREQTETYEAEMRERGL